MDLAYELHDLVRTLDRWAERLLQTEGLSYNRYVALVIGAEHPGMTGRDLARALGISEPSTSALVRKLIDAGLFEDIAPEGAGNLRRLAVTPAGVQKMQACSAILGNSLDLNAEAVGVDPGRLAATIRSIHDEVRTVRDPQPERNRP
jgi:DNA-binding MarR family transcriptional regulator